MSIEHGLTSYSKIRNKPLTRGRQGNPIEKNVPKIRQKSKKHHTLLLLEFPQEDQATK